MCEVENTVSNHNEDDMINLNTRFQKKFSIMLKEAVRNVTNQIKAEEVWECKNFMPQIYI